MPAHSDDPADGTNSARPATIATEIDRADSDRVDPPADLWTRIASSIAENPIDATTGTGCIVEYSIDANDIVVSVGANWDDFARDNDAPELAGDPPRRELWSFFGTDEVRRLWRLVIEQVRARQIHTRVPFRCDAPHTRRWFELTITPTPDGSVHFRSVLVFEEPRPIVTLLMHTPDHPTGVSAIPAVPVCSWCGDGYDGSRWRQIEQLVSDRRLLEEPAPAVDYGICPACRDLMSVDVVVAASNDR